MNKEDILKIINNRKKNNNKSINLQLKAISVTDLDSEIINELMNFDEIDLSRNMLTALPTNFKLLKNLKKLTLADNYINVFPKEIFELNNLKFLDIGHNKIKNISSGLEKLQKLKYLFLKDNPLEIIPNSLFNLKNLEVLGLVNTKVISIPKEINKLQKLKSLWIGKNKIKKLPKGLLKLNSMEEITLDENPLPISTKTLNTKKANIIFDAYQKYQKNLLITKFESKIIIVGESQAGKTSLLNRLIYGKYYADEPKTENINIDDWNIHCQNKIIQVDVWDFGGQDILYSLHKYFLTTNCIYILVWDARNENQSKKIEQWLKIIKSINENPKILLVMNKVDEHNTSISKVHLNSIVSDIQYYNISCKNNMNINMIENDIKNILENNENLVIKYDTNLIQLKILLSNIKSKKPYIKTKDLKNLILESTINMQYTDVIDILRNSGKILYYEDNFRLRDIIIIDIQWFIEGIYTVINWISKNQKGGYFSLNDLESIFSSINYFDEHDIMTFFIDSLLHFHIIFIKNDVYYFPNLLDFFDKDINLIINNNYSKFRISAKNIEDNTFFELMVKYANRSKVIHFWRDLIHIEQNNTNIYIYLSPKKKIFVYIEKANNDSIDNILTIIIEDFKEILKRKDIDLNVLLPDGTQVSVLHLKFLQKQHGYSEYISEKQTKYSIDEIFGKYKVNKDTLPSNPTSIYHIEKVNVTEWTGDALGDTAKKEINYGVKNENKD